MLLRIWLYAHLIDRMTRTTSTHFWMLIVWMSEARVIFPRYTTSAVGPDVRPVWSLFPLSRVSQPGHFFALQAGTLSWGAVLGVVGCSAASLASSTPPQVVTTENVFRYCQIPLRSGEDKNAFVENHCYSHKGWKLNKYIHIWTLSSLTCGQMLRLTGLCSVVLSFQPSLIIPWGSF